MTNALHEALARGLVDKRLATARSQRRAHEAEKARRAALPAAIPGRWGQLFRRRPAERPPVTVEATVEITALSPTRLEGILGRTAEQIVETGTRSEAATLRAVSDATRHLSPGAGAALVDWDGSETARLRAFGIVHGVVLRDLDAHDRSRLLERLTGTEPVQDRRDAA